MKKYLPNQTGFTIIDLAIGIAVCGLLGAGIVTAISQIYKVNNMSNAHVSAVKQVENALYYINRDVQMAQSVDTDGVDYWLKVSWTDWEDNQLNEVEYAVTDGCLTRSYFVNSSLSSARQLAQNITDTEITAPDTGTTPPEKAWTIQITATAASGQQQQSETRQVQIVPRSGS
jgi:type II secretory pathway component PulJ